MASKRRGFLLGAVLGSVAALLFAPKSGKDLRGDIKSTTGKIGRKLEDISKELMAEAVKVEKKALKQAKKLPVETHKAVKDAKIIADSLLKKAKHFERYGLAVRRDIVRETREMIGRSAEVLKELKKESGEAASRVVKSAKKNVKEATTAVKKASKPKPKKKPAPKRKR